ncbi:MAG: hypothetical protein E7Z65_01730 [Thermoplasmata archaeon]|jgi:cytoskeletal protein CcmA (bactofilin family)|nr:hypothetical protein [Thermoplasmata archaeon]
MNTKGIKFLAVLAVLAMAFAAFAVLTNSEQNDAVTTIVDLADEDKTVAGQYDYDGETKTLKIIDNTIDVVFNGTDITLGEATTEAMFAAHGLAVQKTTAGGVLYSSHLNDAVQSITADQLSSKKVSIMLLADVSDTVGKCVRNEVAALMDTATFEEKLILEIDLNGYTYSPDGMTGSKIKTKAIDVYPGQTWTIKNGTIKAAEKVIENDAENFISYQLIQSYGKLTITDVTLDITQIKTHSDNAAAAIFQTAGGVVNLGSGVVINANDGDYAAMTAAMLYSNGTEQVYNTHVPSLVIDGATLNGILAADITNYPTNAVGVEGNITTVTVNSGIINGALENARILRANGDNTLDPAVWAKFVIVGGTFTDYSVLKYTDDKSNITIETGGKEIPGTKAKEAEPEDGKVDIDSTQITSGTNAFIVGGDAAVTELKADAGTNNVIIIGNGAAVSGVDLKVNGEGEVAITGFETVTGKITIGTGTAAKEVTLTNAKGTFTFSQGSTVLNTEWEGGTVELNNGDVLKISGNVTGVDNLIKMKDGQTKGATVIIEAGEGKDITIAASAKLTIGANIDVEIEGNLIGLGEGATLGILDVSAAKSLTVKDGGYLSTKVVSAAAGKNVVYSGGDINDAGITAEDIVKWIGKDAATGTWTFDGAVLTLNNYNGTYNFGVIPDDIEKIELNGINAVTVKAPIERTIVIPGEDPEDDVTVYALFGGNNLDSITTDGAGSLAVIVDISDVKGEDLAEPSMAILGGDLKINGVTISIFIDGSNIAWTDEQKEEMAIAGIFAIDGLDFFDAPTMVKVMPDYDYDGLIGIASLGDLNITGKSMLIEAATAIAACDATTIKTATVDVKGDVVLLDFGFEEVPVGFNNLTISNISTLTITGKLVAADATVSQESTIIIKDALIDGFMDNKGIVTINGDVMVTGAIRNYALMENNGFIGVYGWFINDVSATTAPGVFTNNGTVKVYAMEQNIVAEELVTEATLVINDATAPTAGNAKLKSIAITDALMQFDGTIKFNATIQVYNPAGEVVDVTDKFEGVITPGLNGYTMSLHSNSASITIDYDSTSTEPTKVGKGYKISVTGSVSIWEQSLYLQANTTTSGSEATITTDTVKLNEDANLIVESGAIFDIAAGTIDNKNHITVYASGAEEIIEENATFNGNLATYLGDVTISGAFNGDLIAAGEGTVTVANFNGNIHSHGSVVVSASKTMTGDITAKNNVTINGNLVGNILASGNVVVVNMVGKITVDRPNADADPKTVTLDGIVIVEVVYISNYKESTTATEPTMFTATMAVGGTPNDLIIDLAKGSDATASAEAVPGFFKINNTGELGDNKTVAMALTEGRILVDSVKTLEARYYLTIEAGATIEVNKSAASLDVKKAALKVSKDANALFEVGPGASVNYGKVYFVMAFEIENGAYTIYSDVAYALLNCEENTELYVGESATIDQDVVVKAGVNIVVEDITLTFNGKDVEMLEGAKITLEGTGKVIFKPTQTNYESIKEGEEITYYTVSATIVYGDNSIVFDEARFFMDDSTIQGVAATASADAKIKTDFQLIAGQAKVSGLGTGSVKLFNTLYDETKSDDSETFCVFGTFVVAADAVFDAVKLEDSAAMVKYKDTDNGPEVKEIVMNSTIVGVEGTLNLLNDTTVLGGYVGFGHVTIAANNTLTVDKGDLPDDFDVALNYPGSLNTYVVDTTEDANGYLFNFTSPVAGIVDLVLKAEKLTIGGEKVDAVTISGLVASNSIIKAVDDAYLNGLALGKDSIIYGEDVYIIVNDSTTVLGGSVGAKNIHMGEAPFKDLIYETVFMEDGYYIYTQFDSIDWDEVSDVVIAHNVEVDKLDLSGKDVNIVITEDATLTVTKLLIIGTPATVLGDEGSSIIGKVVIDSEDGYKAYIVAYADANLLLAEIVGADGDDAVFSKLDIEDVVYATIFADADDELVLAKADAALIPEITGYNFTAWLNYNGDAKAEVGETNAYADARAVYLTITVKYVAGVDYYMNGTLFNVYDIPTDVPYGSYFTAKISDTTKYQGNPLINGEKTVCVIDDMELVASGVTPIPEPTPEPAVGDSGLSLTDILLIVLVILIAIMVVILVLRLNRS